MLTACLLVEYRSKKSLSTSLFFTNGIRPNELSVRLYMCGLLNNSSIAQICLLSTSSTPCSKKHLVMQVYRPGNRELTWIDFSIWSNAVRVDDSLEDFREFVCLVESWWRLFGFHAIQNWWQTAAASLLLNNEQLVEWSVGIGGSTHGQRTAAYQIVWQPRKLPHVRLEPLLLAVGETTPK